MIWTLTLVIAMGNLVKPEVVTFSKHVAPIIWKNCASCHRPGEVGPFPLVQYKEVAKRADFVAEVCGDRRMPPWKAEPGYGKFRDERRLTDAEIKILADWAKAGAPEGDPRDLPPVPKFVDGWRLGEPDLVVKMPEGFTVPAAGRDILQCFVIPLPLDKDQIVTAVEVRPGNRRVAHHALLFLDQTGAARKRDAAEPGAGYRTFGGPGFVPSGSIGAWVPGATPRHLPDGVGKYLRKGSDLVLQMHYHPSGKEEKDLSTIGFHFSKKPVEKLVGGIVVMGRMLFIPAGAKNYRVSGSSDPLPTAVDAISVSPHMHNIGREIKAWANAPDGREIPLVWIKDWDFNWQGSYSFEKSQRLPKGSVIRIEAVYDNSEANPRNPSDPPRLVRWGEQTTDEMCLFGMQVVTDSLSDLREVMQMRGNRLGAMLGAGPPRDLLEQSKKKK